MSDSIKDEVKRVLAQVYDYFKYRPFRVYMNHDGIFHVYLDDVTTVEWAYKFNSNMWHFAIVDESCRYDHIYGSGYNVHEAYLSYLKNFQEWEHEAFVSVCDDKDVSDIKHLSDLLVTYGYDINQATLHQG